jgi:hypothetical protein
MASRHLILPFFVISLENKMQETVQMRGVRPCHQRERDPPRAESHGSRTSQSRYDLVRVGMSRDQLLARGIKILF